MRCWAWADKLVDVTDVVETQREEYTETALLSAHCYNSVEKKRSFYGVPYTTATLPNHIWRSLVEKAGFKMEDIPKTWDAYYDFFKDVQKKLRAQGMRHVYGLGFQVTTQGNDPNNTFNYFLIAYGGQDIVSKDGKLHLDDPKVKEAAIKALTYPTTAYKEGFVPPGAINWNDADDNNAFHAKPIVMDLDGTISTEVAVFHNAEDYDDIVTMGLPLSNDGKPVPSQASNGTALIPKGAKNVDVAKDFLKYFIQPKVNNEYLKVGLARSIPAMPSIVKNDPWWLDPRPAPGGLRPAGPARPDRAEFLGFQPGLCRGPEPACLGPGLGRCHDRRDDAAGGGGQGVQAGRDDLRQIPDRAELRGEHLQDLVSETVCRAAPSARHKQWTQWIGRSYTARQQ